MPVETTNNTENTSCDIPKPSIDILKEAKPSENIAISDREQSSETLTKESTEIKTDQTVIETIKDDVVKSPSVKNQSDIFSVKEIKNLPCTIFSVSGAPSKTIQKSSNDTIGSKQSQFRNPLTGIGVNSKDEFKTKPSKRKGNNSNLFHSKN